MIINKFVYIKNMNLKYLSTNIFDQGLFPIKFHWFYYRMGQQNIYTKSFFTKWVLQPTKYDPIIQFNYFRNGELINVKSRGKNKDFKLYKDAELIFYNLDATIDNETILYKRYEHTNNK